MQMWADDQAWVRVMFSVSRSENETWDIAEAQCREWQRIIAPTSLEVQQSIEFQKSERLFSVGNAGESATLPRLESAIIVDMARNRLRPETIRKLSKSSQRSK